MSTILVTGAAGFAGSHLLDLLGQEDVRVVALRKPGVGAETQAAYRVGDAVFVGDALFMPDVGSARCDFPGGDARTLYRSIRKIFALPEATRLFMCHDYKAPGRDHFAWESTVAEERARKAEEELGKSMSGMMGGMRITGLS